MNSPETQAVSNSYQAMVLHRERGTEGIGDTLRFSSLTRPDAGCLYATVQHNRNEALRSMLV